VTDPSGGVTEFSWTVQGRLRHRVDPDGQRTCWEYDAEEQVVAVVDPLGGVTRFEPGPFGVVTARTDADGRRFEFGYDADLNLLEVRNPAGASWQYTYDAAGQLIAEHDFIGRSLSYAYDAAGQLTERTNGLGDRTTLARDAAGRVVGRTTPAGDFAYSYDPAGRMVSAAGPTGTVEFAHDAAGRIIRESTDGRAVAYDYDGAGRQTRRVTPSGAVSTWAFDQAGRPVRLDSGTDRLTFAFDAAGREIDRALGAGGHLTRELDAAGRPSSLRLWSRDQPASQDTASDPAGGRRPVLSRDWSYRADGVPAEITDSINGTTRYASDGTGRVTSVQAATWTESYAYDGFGNLAQADSNLDAVEQGAYEADKTLIRRLGRTSYEHDAAGRLIRTVRRTLDGRRLTVDYTWDSEDHLTQVVVPDGTTWRYQYDAIGRRSGKTHLAADGTPLETVTFVWEGNRLAEQQSHRPDGTVVALTWDYEPGSFRPAAQTRRTWASDADQADIDRAFHAIVGDLVGSPTELVSADGTVAWHITSTLWGRTIGVSADPGADCPLRFPGQYFDAETGLHYNVHRYYDPDTAAYLTPDPLGLAPAPNDHAYVSNPLVWLDPLGLEGCVVTVYRAQRAGGHSERVLIDGEGNVAITGENMLHVNMSNEIAHTEAFRGAESQIVAFDVPKTFVEKIQATAVKQRPPSGMSRREFNIFKNGKPQIDDPKQGPDLYGIPHDLFGGSNFSELVSQIVPGSGRVIR
jgi:RHS repeat-associated protein